MKYGLLEVLGSSRFFAGGNYAGLKAPANLAANYTLSLPGGLPGSTQVLSVDSSGNLGYFTPTSGTVTNVALTAPSIFNVTGSPITASGTLALALANQGANQIFASPNGTAGVPSFRGLVLGDFASLPRLDQFAAPTAPVSFNGQKITNLADPTAATDAATKAYVDAQSQGLDIKPSVRVATSANITLSGTQTIDGIATTAGDRVLVKNQTSASGNGIYIVASGAWTRATDADTSAKFTPGSYVFVEEGTTNADTGWVLITDAPITLGTTGLSFAQFSSAGTIFDGGGLIKTGNTISVGSADPNRIVVNPDSIDLAQTGVTAGTFNSVSVDVYGRVSAGTLSNYGTVYRTSFTNASLVSGLLTVNHNLGQKYVSIMIYDSSDRLIYPDQTTCVSNSQATVDFTFFGALTGTYYLVAIG